MGIIAAMTNTASIVIGYYFGVRSNSQSDKTKAIVTDPSTFQESDDVEV